MATGIGGADRNSAAASRDPLVLAGVLLQPGRVPLISSAASPARQHLKRKCLPQWYRRNRLWRPRDRRSFNRRERHLRDAAAERPLVQARCAVGLPSGRARLEPDPDDSSLRQSRPDESVPAARRVRVERLSRYHRSTGTLSARLGGRRLRVGCFPLSTSRRSRVHQTAADPDGAFRPQLVNGQQDHPQAVSCSGFCSVLSHRGSRRPRAGPSL